jgi:hypothetical protein
LLKVSVSTRATSTPTLLRRRRDGWFTRVAEAPSGRDRTRSGDAPDPEHGAISAARVHRRLDIPQDQALYTCCCGFVFEAEVSTSVGCPHCGVAQAW